MIHDLARVQKMKGDVQEKIQRVDALLSVVSDPTLKKQLENVRHQFEEFERSWLGSQLDEQERTAQAEQRWLSYLEPMITLSTKYLEDHEETVRVFGPRVRLIGG